MRLLSAVVVLVLAVGCSQQPTTVELPPIGVTVAFPIRGKASESADFTGRTEGSEYVQVRARVSGYLTKMHFQPGTFVKKDQKLFEIDDRPYKAANDQANASLDQAKARAARLVADATRVRNLLLKNAISREDYDKIVADQAESAAVVRSSEANVERTSLDLKWTTVYAAIDGIVSRDLVSVGNLISADNTILTTIVKQDPIHVYYDIDERTVLRILELIRTGKFKSAREHRVPIRMALANETGFPHEGYVNFVENRVDPSTGTMRIRGNFDNPPLANGAPGITAGLFARIRLVLSSPEPALLVTERAVLNDQDQKYLLVVNSNDEVERRTVQLGQLQDGLRVITSGVNAKDRVIINGLQRVRPGIRVKPREDAMPGTMGKK